MSDGDDNDTMSPADKGQGILANGHDVDQLGEDIGKLMLGLRQRGVMLNLDLIDPNNIRPRVESVAACRMLVAKGICTGAEMAAMVNSELRQILAMILQAVEEQRLAHQRDTIVTPPSVQRGRDGSVKPKLAVVRH